MIKTRKIKNSNEREFLSVIAGIGWQQILTKTNDINKLVNHWTTIFSPTIHKHAPICELRVSERYSPWIDKRLKKLMRTRDKL